MTIALTGGGSGGHITPLLVVASELKRQDPSIRLIYIGQKGDGLADIPAGDPNIDQVYSVRAGKFRRYHGEGLRQLLDISTFIKNIRDVIFVVVGLIQSYFLIRKLKPDIIFSRGGYVSVPVCLGGKLSGVGYITHDSDPIPSLTNRLIGRWAKQNFVALPKELYPYAVDKTITTGIPINRNFVPVTPEKRREYRQKLNIPLKSKLLFVIGGGQGAQSLNEAVYDISPNILAEFEDLVIVHVAGRNNQQQTLEAYNNLLTPDQTTRVKVLDFTDKVYLYSGASDIVVTRGGATNLLEFENQALACIVVPSTVLTGGHQLKNAEILEKNHAAIVINDIELASNSNILAMQISKLLKSPHERKRLAEELSKFAHPNAGQEIATLIIKAAETK